MSDTEHDTLPPEADSFQAQLELTTQLYDDERPEVRLVAHVSTRQLYNGQTLSKQGEQLTKIAQQLSELVEHKRAEVAWRREITQRVEDLEAKFLQSQPNGQTQ